MFRCKSDEYGWLTTFKARLTALGDMLIGHGNNSVADIAAAADDDNGAPVGRAGGQLARFRTGKWCDMWLLGHARWMSPADWWEMRGVDMPELRKVVIRVTSKIPASDPSATNWCLYIKPRWL